MQLLAIGLILDVLLEPDVSIWWGWLWVVVMIVIAAPTVRSRAPLIPGIGWLAALAFTATGRGPLGVLFGFGVFQLEVRTLVPIAGLADRQLDDATVLVARRLVDEFDDKRRGGGGPPGARAARELAARPFVREPLRTALIPQIETTKAVGHRRSCRAR